MAEEQMLEHLLSNEDMLSAEGFTSESRRRERLSWRALLRAEEPAARVEYLPSGKPVLKNSHYKHISVSHCADMVAVMLSDVPCGVDVERCDRNFERVQGRYMSDREQSLSCSESLAGIAWCAKEALYKMAGREGVDFLRDITLQSIEPQGEAWHLVAEAFGAEVALQGVMPDAEHILVFTL
jgi:phosphopantetheinyl transferase